jgi:CheY-like chemotaxis protein
MGESPVSHYRVLLLGERDSVPPALPAVLEKDSQAEIIVEAATAVTDALDLISAKGYDAAVVWTERDDELAGVIRIRKARPDLPIMVVTSRTDPAFSERAVAAGATRTAPGARDIAVLSESIRLSVQSGELRREFLRQSEQARSHAGEIRALTLQSMELINEARDILGRPSTSFVPLLVEDDPNQAYLMLRAFQKADVFSPLPILKSGEEAIEFLSQGRPFVKRTSGLPSVILLDLGLPGISGFEVLEWIRQQPRFKSLPVVILSSSSSPDDINRAYQLGANSYLVKPTRMAELVDLVSGLKLFWGTINHL